MKRRVRSKMAAAKVRKLREQDRAQYQKHRAAVLARKKAKREREGEAMRAAARKWYRRHASVVRRWVTDRYWTGMEEIRDWKQALRVLDLTLKVAEYQPQEEAP